VASFSNSVSVLLNNGDGSFATAANYGAGFSPNSVFAADLDGDGNFDLVTTNGGSDDVSILIDRLPACSLLISLTGDVNQSGTLTSADIIYMVNFVFKSGSLPQPCEANGDVNCNGSVTSADIIYMVNHVFKSGPEPCDVCTLFPGIWTCL